VSKISIAGGVASNSFLRQKLEEESKKFGFSVYYPEKIYCTDNGAMIAAAAYYDFIKGKFSGLDLNAIPYLKIGEK
jgi:N6-L-threonylcarbamoyladenine synthase